MSGLVNGLQNRLQQFESARHLMKQEEESLKQGFLLCFSPHLILHIYYTPLFRILHLHHHFPPLTFHSDSLGMINNYPQLSFVYNRRKTATSTTLTPMRHTNILALVGPKLTACYNSHSTVFFCKYKLFIPNRQEIYAVLPPIDHALLCTYPSMAGLVCSKHLLWLFHTSYHLASQQLEPHKSSL